MLKKFAAILLSAAFLGGAFMPVGHAGDKPDQEKKEAPQGETKEAPHGDKK